MLSVSMPGLAASVAAALLGVALNAVLIHGAKVAADLDDFAYADSSKRALGEVQAALADDLEVAADGERVAAAGRGATPTVASTDETVITDNRGPKAPTQIGDDTKAAARAINFTEQDLLDKRWEVQPVERAGWAFGSPSPVVFKMKKTFFVGPKVLYVDLPGDGTYELRKAKADNCWKTTKPTGQPDLYGAHTGAFKSSKAWMDFWTTGSPLRFCFSVKPGGKSPTVRLEVERERSVLDMRLDSPSAWERLGETADLIYSATPKREARRKLYAILRPEVLSTL